MLTEPKQSERRKPSRTRGAGDPSGRGALREEQGGRSGSRADHARSEGGLRHELIEAALELVENSGTRGLSWREIARRAEVSHSAAYRHFENKEALLAAVAEQGFRSLTGRMLEQMAAAPDDDAARLEALAIAYVEFAAEKPAHFRVMFGSDIPDIDRHPALREAYDETNGLFRERVSRMLERPGRAGLEVDADQFALMAWSLVHGLASLIVDGRVGDVGEAAVAPAEQMRRMTSLVEGLVRWWTTAASAAGSEESHGRAALASRR